MLPAMVKRGRPEGLPDDVWAAMQELAGSAAPNVLAPMHGGGFGQSERLAQAGRGLPADHPFVMGLKLLGEGLTQLPGALAAMTATPGGGEGAGGRFGEGGPPIAEVTPEHMQAVASTLAAKSQTGLDLIQQFGHEMTAGVIDSPTISDPKLLVGWNTVVRPMVTIGAMMTQGRAITGAFGYFSKIPKATALLEQVPARLKEIGAGSVIGGVIDAMRADGIPEDPPFYDPSGKIAKKLSDLGVPERIALAAGGMSVGGIVGASVLGIMRGVQAGRETFYMSKLTQDPKMIEAMKNALVQSGVEVPSAVQPRQVAKMFSDMRKVALDEQLAGTVGSRMSREQFVMDELFGSASIAPSDEDTRLVAGMFRTNTGGMSIVQGVELTPRKFERVNITETGGLPEIATTIKKPVLPRTIVEEASDRLGIRLQFMRVRTGERVTPRVIPSAASADERVIAPATKLANGKIIAGGTGHVDALTWAAEQARTTGNVTLVSDVTRALREDRAVARGAWTTNNRFVTWDEATKMMKGQRGKQVTRSTDVAWGAMPVGEVKEVQQIMDKTPLYDIIVARPKYEYSKLEGIGKKAKAISNAIRTLAKESKATLGETVSKEAWLLPDGAPVRGGFKLSDLERKARLQRPIAAGVERPDLALRIQGQIARMELVEEGKIKIELPPKLTQDQFSAIGRMFDARGFDEVTLVGHDGSSLLLKSPLGAQVQDGVTKLVAPTKVGTRLTPQIVQQYKSQGVFDGQAAVMSDGTPVSIVKKFGGRGDVMGPGGYQVRDPLTGEIRTVHPDHITPLPTTLEGEMKPSNLFNDALNPEEQKSFARLRQALNQGLGKEITTFRQMENFASSRGFIATSLSGGKVELQHAMSGESRGFTSRKAAIEFIRTSQGPMPELTPNEITQLMGGDTNVGFIGGGGAPPRFGETLPLPWGKIMAGLEQTVLDRGPGAIEQVMKPTLALMESIDKKLKTNTLPVFLRGQAQHVHMVNFVAKWYKGLGSKMPEGVESLQRIVKIAGSNANRERITHIMETAEGTADYQRLVSEATPGEVKAAGALRKWYDAMFSELGVEADYQTRYAPHWRANGNRYGNQPAAIWQALGNDPMAMPRGVKFFADQYRAGTLDIYEEDAFKAAASYLHQGASNRYMKEWYDDASKYVISLAQRNKQAAMPLANVIHAMKGTEFLDQRAALQETMRSLMEKLPGGALTKGEGDIIDKMVTNTLGTAYAAAFGARPAAALRNAFSAVYMSWPVFAGVRSDWIESVGRAMTVEGKMAAVEDGAIALKQSSMFMREEIQSAVPKNYEWVVDKSMFMYDSADEFTRATSYWSGRIAAEKALTRFAKDVQGASAGKIEALKKTLIADSGMWLHDEQVTDDFLRRAANNPGDAAKFAGKMASDVTNFLYGRGMQARWMRSVPGRFFGQFGTWSMWYMDFLRRIGGRALTLKDSPYRGKALATLARHAMVNAAIIAAGHEVFEVDLNRWASYGSLFYSGGPGFQLAVGASTLLRGSGETVSGSEDPLTQSRLTQGSQMLLQTMRSFLPFYAVSKDAIRFGTSDDPVDRLAALLGTRPTRDYDFQHRLGLMLGAESPSFSSDSPVVQDLLNAKAAGDSPDVVDIRSAQALRQAQSAVRGSPPPGAGANPAGRQGTNLTGSLSRIRSGIPPAIAYQRAGEATTPAEAKPPRQF